MTTEQRQPPTCCINRDKPPFDNADLRRAMALTLDRKAFIDILTEGQAKIGGAMLPPPDGLWGMPTEMLRTLPGYDPDVQKNRAEAREIMKKLGYGPDKRLAVKVSTRNIAQLPRPGGDPDRPAEADLYRRRARNDRDRQLVSRRSTRKDYTVGMNLTGSGVDDPDQHFLRELRLRLGAQLHRLLQPRDRQADRSSSRSRPTRRSASSWSGRSTQTGRRTAPGRSSSTPAARTCWQPHVKGLTIMVNSIYNGWRMEDVWLDK